MPELGIQLEYPSNTEVASEHATPVTSSNLAKEQDGFDLGILNIEAKSKNTFKRGVTVKAISATIGEGSTNVWGAHSPAEYQAILHGAEDGSRLRDY